LLKGLINSIFSPQLSHPGYLNLRERLNYWFLSKTNVLFALKMSTIIT